MTGATEFEISVQLNDEIMGCEKMRRATSAECW